MSSINPNNIDGTYPIAGQDNDSQGFRDNFTNIKNNFTFAAAELTDIQNNAILKTALSGTTLNNNMNNAQLIGAQILKFTETKNDLGSLSGSITVNWSDGHFQTLETSGAISISFTNWPTSGFWTSFKLQIDIIDYTTHTVTLPTEVSVNLVNIQGASGQTITFTENGTYIFEFSTYDGGTTVVIRDLLRNYDITTSGATANYTTVNASTLVNISATTGSTSTTTGALIVGGGAGFGGNLNAGGAQISIGGGILTSASTNGNLLPNATQLTIGGTSGVANIRLANIYLPNATTLFGGQPTVDLFTVASTVTLGGTSGTANIRLSNIYLPNATTIFGGQATVQLLPISTTVTIGSTSGTANIRLSNIYLPNATTIFSGQNTLTLANTVVQTLNIGGGATAMTLGATNGTVNMLNQANVKGTGTSTSTTTGALVVNGGAGVVGNVTYGGMLISPNTNYITISTSTTYALSSAVSDNVLGITTSALTATLNMPTSPVDGQICGFAANAAVTLALGTGTVSPSFAGAVSAGASFKYVYKAATTGSITGATWYRIA